MNQSYWSRIVEGRITRRRALVTSGATLTAGALLAACGGGSSSSGSSGAEQKKPTSSLLTQGEDTTKLAKAGGTLKMDNPADPPHFDPHLLTLPAALATTFIFNKLLGIKPGVGQFSDGSMQGDLAESWEFSPDKLTLTMKIRADAGTPPQQAPVNGRNLDAEDVVFSWKRWSAMGTNRSDLVNDVNPSAPVLSLTAPDARTIVIKLKEPNASIFSGFSSQLQGQFFILPREADGGFDVRRNPVGAGTYYLSQYTPSATVEYTRNPKSYEKQAYPAKVETPIISENAQVIAQLIAGGVHTHWTKVNAENVLQIKKDAAAIGLYQTLMASVGTTVMFGFKATPPEKTPFRDVRLRQAYGRSIDRDLYLDTFANVSKFKADGLPVDTAWTSAMLPSDYKGWWLDPQSKDFGPNAVNYQYNIAEAKKLLAAAGFPNGIEVNSHQIGTSDYGTAYAPQIAALEGFAGDAGFKFTKVIHGYTTDWNPEIRDSRGFFDGIAYRATPIPAEPGDALYVTYNKSGSFYYGFDPDGKGVTSSTGPFVGDPTCDDLTAKIRAEFDDAKRKALAWDLQRYLGKQQYFTRAHGAATSFDVAWPAVRNFGIFSGLSWGYHWMHYWIDDTQAPLKKA